MEDKPLYDVDTLIDEFNNESPRAQAILGATILDEWLKELIEKFLIDDDISRYFLDHQLKWFSSRINAAYCLGLIGKREHHDFRIILDIRNKFAHSLHDMSFDRQEIISRCNNLKFFRFFGISWG